MFVFRGLGPSGFRIISEREAEPLLRGEELRGAPQRELKEAGLV
jgi:hypothetical protein